MGLFGIGDLENDKPKCRYFREKPSLAFSGQEVMICESVCQEQKKKEPIPEEKIKPDGQTGLDITGGIEDGGIKPAGSSDKIRNKVSLRFSVPKGKLSGIMGVMNYLQSKFRTLEIEIRVKDGAMSDQDYEDKVEEAFRQLGIEVNED